MFTIKSKRIINSIATTLFFIAFLVMLAMVSKAYGAIPFEAGPEFQVNTHTADAQLRPTIASFSNGNFVITWESNLQDGSGYGAYGQIFDKDGNEIGSEFRINTYTTSDQSFPAVAVLSNDNFVVAWKSYEQDGSYDGVYAQIFNSSGTKVGSEFKAHTYVSNSQLYSNVEALNNGNFVISWSSDGQDGSLLGNYAQIFDPSGNKIGDPFQVNTHTSNHQCAPATAVLNNGNFVITWTSYEQDSGTTGIYGQIFNPSGTTVGGEFLMSSYPSQGQGLSSAATLSNGNFIVTWMSYLQDGSANGIYGQIFDNSGTKVGSEFIVNTHVTDEQKYCEVSAFKDSGFVVTWQSENQDGSSWGIYAQLFDNSANKVGDEFLVNTYTTNEQSFPYVTTLSNGDFVITWDSQGQDGSDYGVYAKIYKKKEVKEFQINTYTAGDQTTPKVATLKNGNFIAVYARSDGIYGQIFDKFGNKIGNEFLTIVAGTPAVAVLNNGNFVVAGDYWAHKDGDQQGVFAQIFDSSGNSAVSEFQVNTYFNDLQFNPVIAALSNGDFVIVWSSRGQDGSYDGVYGQVFNSGGSKITSEFRVNTQTTNNQRFASVASLGSNGFVVVWESIEQDGDNKGIYGQRFNNAASPQGTEFQINTHTTSGQAQPSVATLNNGDFVVAWHSYVQDGGLHGIYGQRFSNSGTTLGSEFKLNTDSTGSKTEVSISALDNGNFVATWISWMQDGDDLGIFGQIFDSSGNKIGNEFQINTYVTDRQTVSAVDLSNGSFNVAALSNGNFVAVWQSEGQDGDGKGAFGRVMGFGATNTGQTLNYVESSSKKLDPIKVFSFMPNINATMTFSNYTVGSFETGSAANVSTNYNSALGKWKAWGPIDGVNSLLGNLTFVPTPYYEGNFTINVLLEDGFYTNITDVIKAGCSTVDYPPSLSGSSSPLAYDFCGSKVVDNALLVTDPDNLIKNATVSIRGDFEPTKDYLEFSNQLGITGSYDNVNGKLQLSGETNVANYQSALRSVKYNSAGSLIANKTAQIAFVVNDGSRKSNAAMKSISPFYALNTSMPLGYTEDMPANLNKISIFSPKPTVNVKLVLSDVNAGSINTDSIGGATSTFNSTSGQWQASGPINGVNSLLGSLVFTPKSNYNKDFNIEVLIEDPAYCNIMDAIPVKGTIVNDLPALSGTSSPFAYDFCNPQVIDNTITLTDLDDVIKNATVTITGDLEPTRDSLEFTNQPGITGSYDNIKGKLQLLGDANVANYQTALRSIKYNSEGPLVPNKNIQFSFVVGDEYTYSNTISRGINPFYALNTSAPLKYTEDKPTALNKVKIFSPKSSISMKLTLSDPTAGSLNSGSASGAMSVYNADLGKWETSGTVDGVNSLLDNLVFTPTADYNKNFNIDVSIEDSDYCDIKETIPVSGSAVNDPPTVDIVVKEGIKNQKLGFNETEFQNSFFDIDGHKLSKIKIVSLPDNGELKFLDRPILSGHEVNVEHIKNGLFFHPGNWIGETSFDWKGYDGFTYSSNSDIVFIKINPEQSAKSSSGGGKFPDWAWQTMAGVGGSVVVAIIGVPITVVQGVMVWWCIRKCKLYYQGKSGALVYESDVELGNVDALSDVDV